MCAQRTGTDTDVAYLTAHFRSQEPDVHGWRGRIVCAGSTASLYPFPNETLYGAAKHGASHFSQNSEHARGSLGSERGHQRFCPLSGGRPRCLEQQQKDTLTDAACTAGVLGVVRSLAPALHPERITINAIAPSLVGSSAISSCFNACLQALAFSAMHLQPSRDC